MAPDETPREWAEARALLVHRLSEIEARTRELEQRIAKQNETLSELKLRIGAIAAGIATLVSAISFVLSHFGVTIGRK